MPPRLDEYGFADWLSLRPLTQRLKTRRYRAIDGAYRKLDVRAGDVAALALRLKGRKILIAIAFNDPQTIEWQARLIRLYVPDALYIVADNTPDDVKAAAIATVAKRYGVPYVRLPANPWNVPSRSHGLALNWVWHNVIRRGEPEAFGFLDDDIWPTAPDDPFALLANQDFYGVVRPAAPSPTLKTTDRWFLWAGFCMFRFDAVRNKPLDFGQDWFLGLDTGGSNWDVLYCRVPRGSVFEHGTVFLPFREGLEIADAPFQWCGNWLHEVGLMGDPALAIEKRQVVADLLAPHLARTETLPQES